MLIRDETAADHDLVDEINRLAFEGPEEALLVTRLRQQANPVISLVAEADATVAGHCMFTPVKLDSAPQLKIMGLAPMAVTPAYQGQGVGSALVREGIQRCKLLGTGAVVVLGHPQYYPRFSFIPAEKFGLASEYDVAPGVFMALELQPDYLADTRGTISYHPAFSEL